MAGAGKGSKGGTVRALRSSCQRSGICVFLNSPITLANGQKTPRPRSAVWLLVPTEKSAQRASTDSLEELRIPSSDLRTERKNTHSFATLKKMRLCTPLESVFPSKTAQPMSLGLPAPGVHAHSSKQASLKWSMLEANRFLNAGLQTLIVPRA